MTIDLDDETETALAELVECDGSPTLAIKLSLTAEVKHRRRTASLADTSSVVGVVDTPIDQDHLDRADAVRDRQAR